MFRTIREILPLTTLSKPQVDRNYYKVKDQYIPLGLIYKDEDNTRWVHEDVLPCIITRKRKRTFTEKDIKALMYENWSYFGTYAPEDRVSIEHCHAVMEVLFNKLSSNHTDKIKLIYFIENPDTNIHVHYLLKIEGYSNLKSEVENFLRSIVSCNTHFEVYDPEQGDRCKDYITKDLLLNPTGWGYHEN